MKLVILFGMLWGGLYLASRKAPQPTLNDLAPTFLETEDTVPGKQQYNLVKPNQSALISEGSANIVKPLTVGDIVPDITFSNLINYPGNSAKLSDFKGKLVILDFWATWCTSCIASFPKVQELQKEFNEQLQILLVTSTLHGDDENKVNALLQKLRNKNRALHLPIAIDDYTSELFPRQSVPHYAWINEDGKVLAITGSLEVTKENIAKALEGKPLNLALRREVPMKNLVFLDDTTLLKQLKHYSIFIKGKLYDYGGSTGTYQIIQESERKGLAVLLGNYSLMDIYIHIAGRLLPGFDNDGARIMYSKKDAADLFFTGKTREERIEWQNQNEYTIGLIDAGAADIKQLYGKLLEELNLKSDFITRITDTLTKCLVLSRVDATREVKSGDALKKSYPLLQQVKSLTSLKSAIRQLLDPLLPVIDSTGLTYKSTIIAWLPSNRSHYNIDDILRQNNLQVKEVNLRLPVMVIKKRSSQN